MKSTAFYDTTRYKLTLSITMASFFYLFILFFLPFGVDNYNPNHEYTVNFLLEIFYFFLPLLGVTLINELLIRPLFFKNSNFVRIVLWSIWTLVLLCSVVFLTYNFLGNWHDIKWSSYFEFLMQVSSVLLFPMIGTFFFFKYKQLKSQMDHILTTKENHLDAGLLIEFKGQGSKDQITLSLSNFLFGKAQDNYVELHFIEKEEMNKFLMRSSLTNLTDSIKNKVIMRCHRSYLVNLLQVSGVKGNHQDLTLILEPFGTAIPVSRSYQKVILQRLRELKNFN